jgi:hypothetical protein
LSKPLSLSAVEEARQPGESGATETHQQRRLQLWQPETSQAVLQELNIESDSVLQQVYVCLAQIGHQALPGSSLKYSQTANHGETRRARHGELSIHPGE